MSEKEGTAVTDDPSDLPSVEDRSLFLACLTCMVASAYDFDLTVEGTTATDGSNPTNGEHHHKPISPPPLKDEPSGYLDNTATNHPESAEESELIRNIERAIKIQEKTKLAEHRHVVRRYKVARQFILSSAQHLRLNEELVTREYLPILDALLEDDHNVASTDSTNEVQPPAMMQIHETFSGLNSMEWMQHNHLLKYLDPLGSKPAHQCLYWLLFQHLLHAETGGYDARVRYWFKSLAVTLWVRDFELERKCNNGVVDGSGTGSLDAATTTGKSGVQRATKKFEALETCCADRLLALAAAQGGRVPATSNPHAGHQLRSNSLGSSIWKGVQIGSVGVGAGILLIVTGGLAAPGIAAGLAAMGMGAVAGTFFSLASSAAVVSLFGVAGGSLAAYKMNRRVSGLTEFGIQQELATEDPGPPRASATDQRPPSAAPQLFRTIGISGWIQDKSDFQRPWGVTPTNPPIQDKVELLQRFYHIHNPQLVEWAEDIWKIHRHNPSQLWRLLEYKYGCNPDRIFAMDKTISEGLTLSEVQQLDRIIVAIGKVVGGDEGSKENSSNVAESKVEEKNKKNRFSLSQWGSNNGKGRQDRPGEEDSDDDDGPENSIRRLQRMKAKPSLSDPDTKIISDFELVEEQDHGGIFGVSVDSNDQPFEPPSHLNTVWNYPKIYGGELYTVKWESDLLTELSNSIRELVLELSSSAAQQVLKTTVVSTLIFAATLPMAVIAVMNTIDHTWTLVMDRTDEAGKELARSLLVNKGGQRPVTLMGYSFGARIIYVALKELAQYQEKWEEHQLELEKKYGSMLELRKDKEATICRVGDLEFDREPASIVEDAILMGMPNYLTLSTWKACREVVAGRLVNVYSRKDKVLSYIYKYINILGSLKPVVGTCTVAVPGVENIDVTDMVDSHEKYSALAGKILQRVRLGQPVRSSSYALDEVALLEEAENLAEIQAKEGKN